jgi:selenocysteine lyase/cysteine desulfurase
VDVDDIGADFYIVNFHKWLFCPIGVSALWIGKKYLAEIHPPYISNHNKNVRVKFNFMIS